MRTHKYTKECAGQVEISCGIKKFHTLLEKYNDFHRHLGKRGNVMHFETLQEGIYLSMKSYYDSPFITTHLVLSRIVVDPLRKKDIIMSVATIKEDTLRMRSDTPMEERGEIILKTIGGFLGVSREVLIIQLQILASTA